MPAKGRVSAGSARPKRGANGAVTSSARPARGRAAPEKRQRTVRAKPAQVDGEIDSDSEPDSDDNAAVARRARGAAVAADAHGEASGSEDESEDVETADERRVRMAKAMLAKLESAKRAAASRDGDSDVDSDAVERDIDRELAKQAAQAAGRHFERIAARLRAAPAAPPPRFIRAHARAPTALALASDERTAYSGAKDGELLKWDVETGQRMRLTPKAGKRPPIAALALSADGHLLACGGPDRLLHIWDTRIGKCAESFKGHRDGLTALAFGGSKNELFTAAKDRTVKVWNLDEMTYVETLFGHADAITAIDSLSPERAVSVGADRTVRMWKVLEETQLVFHAHMASIDCVRMLTPTSFITGSQDGALCLWLATRKKPVATALRAHGAGAPAAAGSGADGGACNWVSALGVVPSSDLALSGSADGFLRFWRCDAHESSLEQVYSVPVPGFINAIQVAQTSRRFAVVATAQEHRLGSWFRDHSAKNGIAIIPLPPGLVG